MNLDDVTPLILTYNEAPNIERTLEPLGWAREIIVVDSGSTDGTLDLLSQYANVRVVHRAFDDHTSQWNFGLDRVESLWVLSLDADYVLRAEFICELNALVPENEIVAYYAPFRYVVFGRPLRATLYPERAVLFRCKLCRYVADGHTQILRPCGPTARLVEAIDHDDRKTLGQWLDSQKAYSRLEADKLLSAEPGAVSWQDRLRMLIVAAVPAAILYTLVVKWCVLDGWRGWYYAMQRAYAELLLSLELLDRKMRAKMNAESPPKENIKSRTIDSW
jgi:glycosyltransferase involved in cell wall biosynthesis